MYVLVQLQARDFNRVAFYVAFHRHLQVVGFLGHLQRGSSLGVACGVQCQKLIVGGEDAVSTFLTSGIQRTLGVVRGRELFVPA